MKRKDIIVLVVIGLIAALISSFIAGKVFTPPAARETKVPTSGAISSTFPDIQNDTDYQPIFNDKALDPTQLIQIGTSQNQQAFNGQ